MKIHRSLALLLTLSTALLGLAWLGSPAVAAPATPRAVQKVDSIEEFVKQLREYEKISAREEIAQLIKRNRIIAIDVIQRNCEAIAKGTNDRLETDMALLRQGWADSEKSSFVDNMYEYYSLLQLDPRQRAERGRIRARYDKTNVRFIEVEQGQSSKAYLPVGAEFQVLADAFDQVGDSYMSSMAWIQAGMCGDETRAEEHADLNLAVFRYQQALAMLEQIDLKGKRHSDTTSRLKQLYGLGYGEDPDAEPAGGTPHGGGAEVDGAVPVPTGPVGVPMTFELLTAIGKPVRPIYFGDEIFEAWSSLDLGSVDSSTTFPGMEDTPTVVRSSSSKATLDTDGDGEIDVQIPMTGNVEPIQLEIGDGDTRRPWGFVARILGEDAVYQGVTVNLQADDNQMRIFYAPAASVVGEVMGQRFQIVDDNMDGVYGSAPTTWAFMGLVDGHYQPLMDSVIVGKESSARPWSKYQNIDGAWYEIEALNSGMELRVQARPWSTGTVKFSSKGVKFEWLVIVGLDERFAETYIDLVPGGKKGTAVPVGRWKLYAGLVSKGKRRQLAKALVLPQSTEGEGATRIVVKEGETATLKLGAPFGFDFRVEDDGDTVTIPGQSVVVTGVAGERYERPWNCSARPEASVRVAGSKKGGKGKKFDHVRDQQAIYDRGWATPYFPYDLTLDKKKPDEAAEVQLVQKKHKLFGSITSDWKK
jgi:hypothetical protein